MSSLARLASPRGIAAAISAVATLAGLVVALADSQHRAIGIGILVVGAAVLLIAVAWVRLSVAAVKTALANGVVLQTDAQQPGVPLLPLLLAVQGELEHNLDLLQNAAAGGAYWPPGGEGMWPGEWNKARGWVGSVPELVPVYRAVDHAHLSMRKIHAIASRGGLALDGPQPSHPVESTDGLLAVIKEAREALHLVRDAVDARARS